MLGIKLTADIRGSGSIMPGISTLIFPKEIKPAGVNLSSIIKNLNVGSGLGTSLQAIVQSKPFPIKIKLLGFYAGHHYDGFLNGDTGEFFFACLTTNGKVMYFAGSKDGGGGPAGGVFDKISAGQWVDVGEFPLWPDPSAGQPDVTDVVTTGFWLLERDDGALADQILNGITPLTREIVKAAFGNNPVANAGHEAAVKLAATMIGIYAVPDKAITSTLGLESSTTHYNVGRFIKLRGSSGSYAYIEVIPDRPADDNDWLSAYKPDHTGDGDMTLGLKTGQSGYKRLVSVFARPLISAFSYGPIQVPAPVITIQGESFSPSTPGHRSKMLAAGDDDIVINIKSQFPVDVRVLATACHPEGALAY